MADASSKRPKKTQPTSARLYVVDVVEIKRRAGGIPWTIFLREFIHEHLGQRKRRKIQ